MLSPEALELLNQIRADPYKSLTIKVGQSDAKSTSAKELIDAGFLECNGAFMGGPSMGSGWMFRLVLDKV